MAERKGGEGEGSHNRVAADIDCLVDLHQHADAGLRANMGLLARQQLGKNRLSHGPALVQFDATKEAQEATLQHAALRFEVGIHDAYALDCQRHVGDYA
jgi:hypothetical protein